MLYATEHPRHIHPKPRLSLLELGLSAPQACVACFAETKKQSPNTGARANMLGLLPVLWCWVVASLVLVLVCGSLMI